jgi:hypothetical protein
MCEVRGSELYVRLLPLPPSCLGQTGLLIRQISSFSAIFTSNLQVTSRDPQPSRLSSRPEPPQIPIAARPATLNGHAAHHVPQQSLLKLRLLESQSLVRNKSWPNWPGSLRLSRQNTPLLSISPLADPSGVTHRANLGTRSLEA